MGVAAAVAVLVGAVTVLGAGPVQARQEGGPAADELDAADATLRGATARLVAISPERVLDTRRSSQFSRLGTNGSITVAPITAAVAAKAGVAPGDVEAVVVNLTAVDAGDRGWVKVWPAGEPEPDTSSINMGYAGHTIPNLVTMRLGSGQALTIKARSPADIVIDVQAVYVRAASATAGRFVPLTPTRAFDSRESSSIPAGGSVVVDLKTVGVPADAGPRSSTSPRRVPRRAATTPCTSPARRCRTHRASTCPEPTGTSPTRRSPACRTAGWPCSRAAVATWSST